MVVGVALWLRFDSLAARPFHADEATGARIAAGRLEGEGARFDPSHFHGPLLGDLAVLACRLAGQDSWEAMSKGVLRVPVAVAGVLMVLVPFLFVRVVGVFAAALAALCLATSPLLVYYSRMFIHEILLTLCGMVALVALFRAVRSRGRVAAVGSGVALGLMFAVKETFVISVAAWVLAAAAVLSWQRPAALCDRACMRRVAAPFALGAAAFLLTVAVCYTGWFRHPQGFADAFRTFFVYRLSPGHDKSPWWYGWLMLWPKHAAGRWWSEAGMFFFAVAAFTGSWRIEGPRRTLVRFLFLAGLFHFLAYSALSYKTPWLMCLPWAHFCLAAGMVGMPRSRSWRVAVPLLLAGCLLWQAVQSRASSMRLASDARNPYAYVPTRPDAEDMARWLERIRALAPAGSADTAAVIGSGYWPLPWYLRGIPRTGFWTEPPGELRGLAFVFAMPERVEETRRLLAESHGAFPRGLRDGVPVVVFVRNDLMEIWRQSP